jgi:hypothetical protein
MTSKTSVQNAKSVKVLKTFAKELKLKKYSKLKKEDLRTMILKHLETLPETNETTEKVEIQTETTEKVEIQTEEKHYEVYIDDSGKQVYKNENGEIQDYNPNDKSLVVLSENEKLKKDLGNANRQIGKLIKEVNKLNKQLEEIKNKKVELTEEIKQSITIEKSIKVEDTKKVKTEEKKVTPIVVEPIVVEPIVEKLIEKIEDLKIKTEEKPKKKSLKKVVNKRKKCKYPQCKEKVLDTDYLCNSHNTSHKFVIDDGKKKIIKRKN